jgi:hypothetical protein
VDAAKAGARLSASRSARTEWRMGMRGSVRLSSCDCAQDDSLKKKALYALSSDAHAMSLTAPRLTWK